MIEIIERKLKEYREQKENFVRHRQVLIEEVEKTNSLISAYGGAIEALEQLLSESKEPVVEPVVEVVNKE